MEYFSSGSNTIGLFYDVLGDMARSTWDLCHASPPVRFESEKSGKTITLFGRFFSVFGQGYLTSCR